MRMRRRGQLIKGLLQPSLPRLSQAWLHLRGLRLQTRRRAVRKRRKLILLRRMMMSLAKTSHEFHQSSIIMSSKEFQS